MDTTIGSSSSGAVAGRSQVSSSRLVGWVPTSLSSSVSALGRSLLLYVLLQCATTSSSYPLPRAPSSSRCLSRCLLLGARYAYYDVTTCQTICGIRDRGDLTLEDDAPSVPTSAEAEVSSAESPVGRILAILEEMEPGPSEAVAAAAECDHSKWDLRYEKKTEYKQLTLPAVQVQKRRWGSTIGPCISAHCSGQTGASRAACIVKMCNRRRRSRYR